MQLRYRTVLSFVAICLALAVAPAFAAKPAPTLMTPPAGDGIHIEMGTVNTTPTCQLGVLPPAAGAFGYILPPNDAYYVLIDPAGSTCANCPGGLLKLIAGHVQLYWTSPCQVELVLSVVGAGGSPSCPAPNPFDVKCPPTTYILNDGGVLNDCNDYTMPLPAACCVDGPVFLSVEFNQSTCPANRPAFCFPPACNNCNQYNIYPGGNDDLCAVLSPFQIYGLIEYADVTCCQPTPTLPGSWGLLKTLYR